MMGRGLHGSPDDAHFGTRNGTLRAVSDDASEAGAQRRRDYRRKGFHRRPYADAFDGAGITDRGNDTLGLETNLANDQLVLAA
jgi:hypothetical protein